MRNTIDGIPYKTVTVKQMLVTEFYEIPQNADHLILFNGVFYAVRLITPEMVKDLDLSESDLFHLGMPKEELVGCFVNEDGEVFIDVQQKRPLFFRIPEWEWSAE